MCGQVWKLVNRKMSDCECVDRRMNEWASVEVSEQGNE
jgi:hypothetical protein